MKRVIYISKNDTSLLFLRSIFCAISQTSNSHKKYSPQLVICFSKDSCCPMIQDPMKAWSDHFKNRKLHFLSQKGRVKCSSVVYRQSRSEVLAESSLIKKEVTACLRLSRGCDVQNRELGAIEERHFLANSPWLGRRGAGGELKIKRRFSSVDF